ncbi:MAG: hypothetical protein ACJ72V_16655 [Nitrososphaeraceae archaeon]
MLSSLSVNSENRTLKILVGNGTFSSSMERQEKQQQVHWRRDKVQELCSNGYRQREISQILQVGLLQ